MRITPAFSLVLALSVSFVASAQTSGRYAIGFNLGTFVYSGDLSPWRTGSWKTPGFVWGLSGHRVLSPVLSARLDFSFGKLRGDEARYDDPVYHRMRAFAFNSNVTEIAVAAEWSPLGRTAKVFPYATAGIGYASMQINRDYSRFHTDYFASEVSLKEGLGQDAATAPPRGVAIFPVGLGLQYTLSSRLSLHAEAAHRFTRSDYIDGFSRAANPTLKDSYTKYSIGIRLSLGNKDKYGCPPVD